MPPTIRQRNLQAKNGSKRAYGTKTSKKFAFWKSDKKSTDADILVTNAPTVLKKIYYPGAITAFIVLLVVRLCSATWNQITDCDETYNYWEPIHYLVFGSGLQTWEYSPLYAIRSYASLWIFAGPAWYLNYLVKVSPVVLFYFLRYFLACFTAFCETVFYKAICQEFGVHVARLWLVFTLSSCGTFISSTAMLPSAWCAALSSAALGAWWFNNLGSAIFLVAVSALLGWPFAGLIGLPIALDILFRKWKIIEFATWSILSLTIILGPVVWIDSMHYGRLVVAPFNIISYNIFTNHGPDLYGVEPWSFYFLNLFLNFNIIWVLCLLCPMLLMVCWLITQAKPRARFCQPYWLSLMPLYIWLAVFIFQPHKEERFMFPVYSMICLYGAISVDCLQKIWFSVKTYYVHVCVKFFRCKDTVNLEQSKRTHYLAQTNYMLLFILILSSLSGASRTFGLYKNYHAPMEVMRALELESVELNRVNVCFGKDWYRSPSSFFLPNENYRLRFIKSEFEGMLPAPYADGLNATREIHSYFNDQNKEDSSTYINVTSCHYLIDTDLESPTDLQPNYAELSEDWIVVTKLPILNAKRSHRLFRSFYIPYFNKNFTHYGNIYLLRNVNMNISRILNFS